MAGSVYDIKKLTREVTITVRVSSEFRIRKFIALKLIKLAVIILGCRLEVAD